MYFLMTYRDINTLEIRYISGIGFTPLYYDLLTPSKKPI
jgi:hypothetical protein